MRLPATDTTFNGSPIRHQRRHVVCARLGPQPLACHSGEDADSAARYAKRLIKKQTGAIDDVHRAVAKTDDAEKQAEGKKIIEQLGNLKYEVLHDRKLTYVR